MHQQQRQDNSQYDVFISYHRTKYKEVVFNFKDYLVIKYGLRTWIDDEQIKQENGDIKAQIQSGIANATLFLCFLTKEYDMSLHCRNQVSYASNINKIVLVLMLDGDNLSDLSDPTCANLASLLVTKSRLNVYKELDLFRRQSGKMFDLLVTTIYKLLGKESYLRAIQNITKTIKVEIEPSADSDDDKELVLFYLESKSKITSSPIRSYWFQDNKTIYLTYDSVEAKQRVLMKNKFECKHFKLTMHEASINIKKKTDIEPPKSVEYDRPYDELFRPSYNNILEAARHGDVKEVKYWVEHGSDPNQQDSIGLAPIHHAAEEAQIRVVKYLHQIGVDLELVDRKKETCLHLATWHQNYEVVKYLCEQKMNLNRGNNNGATPLHIAAWMGDMELVQILASYPQNFNNKNNDGFTPLHNAAYNGHNDVIRVLCSKGTDLFAKDKKGQTPLHLATQNGRIDTVRLLCSLGMNMGVKDDYGSTALHIAVRKNQLAVIKFLSCLNINVNEVDSKGYTPLHYAKNHDIERILIEKGAM